MGQTFRELRGEAVYAQVAFHMDAVLEGDTRHFEVTDDIDGIRHHFQHSFVPDFDPDGTVQGFYSVAFDITDMRRSEKLLIESSARHRQIVEEQSKLVSLRREEGDLIYVNRAFARQFGLKAAHLVGTRFLDRIVPADQAAARSGIDAVFATGLSSSGDGRVLSAGGKERWVAWTHTIQRDAHGGILLRSVGRDITEQRQAESALQASQAFCRARVEWPVSADGKSIWNAARSDGPTRCVASTKCRTTMFRCSKTESISMRPSCD